MELQNCKVYEQRVIMLWPKTKLYVQSSATASIEEHMIFLPCLLGSPKQVLTFSLLQNRCKLVIFLL